MGSQSGTTSCFKVNDALPSGFFGISLDLSGLFSLSKSGNIDIANKRTDTKAHETLLYEYSLFP